MTVEEYYNLKIGQRVILTFPHDHRYKDGVEVYVDRLANNPRYHQFLLVNSDLTTTTFFLDKEWLSLPTLPIKQAKKEEHFPHKCPRCKAPAYIGFQFIECQSKCY